MGGQKCGGVCGDWTEGRNAVGQLTQSRCLGTLPPVKNARGPPKVNRDDCLLRSIRVVSGKPQVAKTRHSRQQADVIEQHPARPGERNQLPRRGVEWGYDRVSLLKSSAARLLTTSREAFPWLGGVVWWWAAGPWFCWRIGRGCGHAPGAGREACRRTAVQRTVRRLGRDASRTAVAGRRPDLPPPRVARPDGPSARRPKTSPPSASTRRADKRAKAVERLLAKEQFGVNWARYWRDVIIYRRSEDRALLASPAVVEDR